jgi:hypothetical protein
MPRDDIELQVTEAQVPREDGEPVREEKIRDRQFRPQAQLQPGQFPVIPCAVPQFPLVGSHGLQICPVNPVPFFMQ